jgi:hypothetical protein
MIQPDAALRQQPAHDFRQAEAFGDRLADPLPLGAPTPAAAAYRPLDSKEYFW